MDSYFQVIMQGLGIGLVTGMLIFLIYWAIRKVFALLEISI